MYHIMGNIIQLDRGITEGEETQGSSWRRCFKLEISFERVVCHNDLSRANLILIVNVGEMLPIWTGFNYGPLPNWTKWKQRFTL